MRTALWYIIVVLLTGTAAAALCIVAEFRKSMKNDLRFDGKICSLGQSSAFGLGIAALICLLTGQITANFFVYFQLCSDRRCRRKNTTHAVPYVLLGISWVIFLLTVFLLSSATVISQSQPLGEGWVDGECYLVKSGVYGGSAVLGFLALGLVLASAMTMRPGGPEVGNTPQNS